ncbi:hypothetical protein AB6D20_027675 (plasmid) [Vibrio splendidus]
MRKSQHRHHDEKKPTPPPQDNTRKDNTRKVVALGDWSRWETIKTEKSYQDRKESKRDEA